MWQSGYEVLDTTIVLQGGKHLLLKNKMIEMPEYVQYKQDLTKYLNRKVAYYSLPIVPILASIHFTNQFVKRYNTAQSEMDYYYEQSLFSKQRIETTMNYEEYMSSLFFLILLKGNI